MKRLPEPGDGPSDTAEQEAIASLRAETRTLRRELAEAAARLRDRSLSFARISELYQSNLMPRAREVLRSMAPHLMNREQPMLSRDLAIIVEPLSEYRAAEQLEMARTILIKDELLLMLPKFDDDGDFTVQ